MDRESFLQHADHEQKHWWFLARRQIVTDLLEDWFAAHSIFSPRIVEVGCGTGANVAAMANRFDCLGADISLHAIKLAREQFPQCQFEHYQQPSELSAAIADADAVLLLDVLEHVRDEFQLFSELVSDAKPGALLLVTVPADPNLWSAHDEALFHFRRYTAERLEMVWQGLPVEKQLVSGLNWRLAPIVRSVRAIQGKPKLDAKPKSDLSMPAAPANFILRQIFGSESGPLRRALRQRQTVARRRFGVSLIAMLKRVEGQVSPRSRPENCPPDQHDVPEFDLGIEPNREELTP